MVDLPKAECITFLSASAFYLVAAVIGWVQLAPRSKGTARSLMPLVCLATCLQLVVLIFRAVTIKVVPLTGLFESMLVLVVVLSLIYLFLSLAIQQVWFGSVMTSALLLLQVIAGFAAQPAAEPSPAAATPWAVFHGLAMVTSSALIVFATASAFLYLLSDYRLKHKRVLKVLGRVPSVAWLRRAQATGLMACLVTLTCGLVSGAGMAIVQATEISLSLADWLTDLKTLCILAAWLLLIVVLTLRSLTQLSDKKTAYATLLAFGLILFAVLGVALLGDTVHAFTMQVQSLEFRVQSLLWPWASVLDLYSTNSELLTLNCELQTTGLS